MDINEEIVKEYFTSCLNCFMHENVLYKVETQREGKKKGGGWSDIDLLAYYPEKDEIFDIEVKYRQVAPFHRGSDKASNLDKVISNYTLASRIKKISEYNPRNINVRRVFVTNKRAFTNARREEYEALLVSENIELLYFEDVFEKLQKHVKENSNKMTSVVGQVMRVINNQEKALSNNLGDILT